MTVSTGRSIGQLSLTITGASLALGLILQSVWNQRSAQAREGRNKTLLVGTLPDGANDTRRGNPHETGLLISQSTIGPSHTVTAIVPETDHGSSLQKSHRSGDDVCDESPPHSQTPLIVVCRGEQCAVQGSAATLIEIEELCAEVRRQSSGPEDPLHRLSVCTSACTLQCDFAPNLTTNGSAGLVTYQKVMGNQPSIEIIDCTHDCREAWCKQPAH